MLRSILYIMTFFLGLETLAQTCQIVSNTDVCKEELINFDVTSSGTIQSAVWDMGDASTSTQINFNHKYSTGGTKNVKVTLTLAGGGTCVATKQITVNELPQFKITQKPTNDYCLSQNKVCLVDSSTGGSTGRTIQKRIVIWDDGDQSLTNNPPLGDNICHTYKNIGKFKITTELTNDKGCKATLEIPSEILIDKVPKIKVTVLDNIFFGFCDSSKVLFEDSTYKDTSDVIGKIYNWGNGKSDTTRSKKLYHTYYKTGYYKVSLSFIQKNGCKTIKDTVIYVIVSDLKPNVTKNADTQCYESVFRLRQNDLLIGGSYYWHVGVEGKKGEDNDGKFTDIIPAELGKNYVRLRIVHLGCSRVFDKVDSLFVIGHIPKIIVLNNDQCDNRDTVFFRDIGVTYGSKKLSYLWDLDDEKAPQCTTNTEKGLNVNGNCNFSNDSMVKHKYVDSICRNWSVSIKDSENGCFIPYQEGFLNLYKPQDYNIKVINDKPCIGERGEYAFHFEHTICPLVNVQVNIDSARDRKYFSPKYIYSWIYKEIASKDGWVTVGFAMKFGRPHIYRSYDTLDYYVDSGRICYDTVWKHNWYNLLSQPDANFKKLQAKCFNTPIVAEPVYKQHKIVYSIWDWGDGSKLDTFFIPKGDSMLPKPNHLYKKPGQYIVIHDIENENTCFDRHARQLSLGFVPVIKFDEVICPGFDVHFNDSTYYMDTLYPPIPGPPPYVNMWQKPHRRLAGEEIQKWDFGDGRGFVTDTIKPVVNFPNKGTYTIRLAAKDSTDCWDTATKVLTVGGAHAVIKTIDKRLICDDIIQLFDSSYSDFKPPADSIIKHYWEFGDNGNPSYLPNPYHFYKTFGEYTIFLKVENTRGCTDSVSLKIKIEGPQASFDIISDTVGCAPFKAVFKNTSINTRDYIWYFGDPLNSKLSTNRDTNVTFTYTQPGVYDISLFGSDSVINPNAGNAIYFCKSNFPDTSLPNPPRRRIVVLASPKIDFNVNPIQCKNKPIVVTDNSDTIYKRFQWIIPDIDTLVTFNKTGILISGDTGFTTIKYSPSFIPSGTTQNYCIDTIEKVVRVTEATAKFDIFKDTTACPVFTFTNTTTGLKSGFWNLGDSMSGKDNISMEKTVSHKYASNKGIFYPCLMVENFDGCRDTLCQEIEVDVITKLIIPNVFTPNNDKLNDAFDIDAENLEEYDLTIYNRWGQLLFHTTTDGKGNDGYNWTGRPNVVEDVYPDGTYFYIFSYKYGCDTLKHRAQGTITLIGGKD